MNKEASAAETMPVERVVGLRDASQQIDTLVRDLSVEAQTFREAMARHEFILKGINRLDVTLNGSVSFTVKEGLIKETITQALLAMLVQQMTDAKEIIDEIINEAAK